MADYPDWVLKHKKKGTYINKVGDKYYLYAAHSERIKGTGKVRRVSDGYLGRITEADGLIPPKSKVSAPITSLEFGLSFCIISSTPLIHIALRRSFSKYGDLVYSCAILSFIYGLFDRELFDLSYLHLHFPSVTWPSSFPPAQLSGIERGHRMISDTMTSLFQDDLPLVKAHFSTIRLLRINGSLYSSALSPAVLSLSQKYNIDWSSSSWQK